MSKEAEKYLEDNGYSDFDFGETGMFEFVTESMQKFSDIQNKPNWISVKDRLPLYGMEVIIANVDNDVCVAYLFSDEYNNIYKTGFHDDEFVYMNIQPTHWMPLPDPPKH